MSCDPLFLTVKPPLVAWNCLWRVSLFCHYTKYKKKNEILVLLKFWNIRGKSMFLISWSLRALSSSLPLVASKLPGLLYQTLTSHSDKEKNITFSAYIIDYILFQPNVKYKCTHMKSYTCWVLELHSKYLTAPIIFLSSSPCYSNSSYYYSQSYDFL